MSRIRLQDLGGVRALCVNDLCEASGGLLPRSLASWKLFRSLLGRFGSLTKFNSTLGRVNSKLWRPTPSTGKPPCTGLVSWNGTFGFCE